MDKSKMIVKEIPIEIKESNDKDRTIHAIMSKQILDRDGDVIIVKGINAKYWKENPVIMADHGHTIDKLIGKGIGRMFWIEGDEAHVKYQLATEEENPLAEMAYRLYKGGYLKTMSWGFIPNFEKVEWVENAKKSGYPEGTRRVFHESEMLEATITPLPSNRAAYMKGLEDAWEAGLLDGEELNEMKDLAPEEKEFETTVVENIQAKDELTTKVKDLAKVLQEKTELENKVAELELMIKEQEMNDEIDWDDYIAELFSEDSQGTSSETEADGSQTDEEWAEEVLNSLEENE